MTFHLSDTPYRTDSPEAKQAMFDDLHSLLKGMVDGERDLIANTANFSALVFNSMPDLNWAGFYLLRPEDQDELVLGPFQGKPACIRIKRGRGVCGAALASASTQLVPDVHAFPGHIACDAASRSELVVPVFANGKVIGVFDLDSPLPNRFDQVDADGIQSLVKLLEATLA